MSINYKKENERYTNIIKEYRQETKYVKDKRKYEMKQRQKNKKLPTETEYEMLFSEIEKNNLEWLKEPIILEDKTYSFVNFNKTKIGKTAVISENDMWVSKSDFWNVDFTDCIFQNVKFENCRFFGCTFNNCRTTEFGVVFEDCFFNTTSAENNEKGEFEIKIVSTEFVECKITNAKFRKCRLENTIWDNCIFISTAFNQCSVKESIFTDCGFYSMVFNDSDIGNVGILKMNNADLEFYGKYQDSEFHKSTYIDLMDYKINRFKKESKIKDKEVASDLAKMYYTLLNSLQLKNSDADYLGEYRYQYQIHHMIAKQKWYLQIWDRISWLICGFGEKLGRFGAWFVGSVLLFALFYMFSGLQLPNRTIEYVFFGGYPVGIWDMLADFLMCVHFSVVTFSTVGYGNITPLNGISTCLCTVQILIGILFVAIFTSIMIKKLIR